MSHDDLAMLKHQLDYERAERRADLARDQSMRTAVGYLAHRLRDSPRLARADVLSLASALASGEPVVVVEWAERHGDAQ